MQRYTLAILVKNEFGVLNRVTSMFRRRMFNISCLTVSETESPRFSRITVIFDGEDQAVKGQHYKFPHDYPKHWVSQQYLPDVIKNAEYYTFGDNKIEKAARAYWDAVKGNS